MCGLDPVERVFKGAYASLGVGTDVLPVDGKSIKPQEATWFEPRRRSTDIRSAACSSGTTITAPCACAVIASSVEPR